jgi:hypothetical protein
LKSLVIETGMNGKIQLGIRLSPKIKPNNSKKVPNFMYAYSCTTKADIAHAHTEEGRPDGAHIEAVHRALK